MHMHMRANVYTGACGDMYVMHMSCMHARDQRGTRQSCEPADGACMRASVCHACKLQSGEPADAARPAGLAWLDSPLASA